jgi:hypothetical protein
MLRRKQPPIWWRTKFLEKVIYRLIVLLVAVVLARVLADYLMMAQAADFWSDIPW